MCFVWLSEQRVTFSLSIFSRLVFITEVDSVYSAVRTESLYNIETSRPQRVNVTPALYVARNFTIRLLINVCPYTNHLQCDVTEMHSTGSAKCDAFTTVQIEVGTCYHDNV